MQKPERAQPAALQKEGGAGGPVELSTPDTSPPFIGFEVRENYLSILKCSAWFVWNWSTKTYLPTVYFTQAEAEKAAEVAWQSLRKEQKS